MFKNYFIVFQTANTYLIKCVIFVLFTNKKIVTGEYEIIKVKKRNIILYNNFTYSKVGRTMRHQYCSKKSRNDCRAKLTLREDGSIESAYTCHNHPPPMLMKTPNGVYYTR